ICISRRSVRIRSVDASVSSSPSKRTDPAVGSMSRSTVRAVVDLPQPDSPTSATVWPRSTENETPSTAFTVPIWWRMMIPRVTGKCLTRPATSRRATASAHPGLGPGLDDPVLVVAGGEVAGRPGQRRHLPGTDLGGEGAAGMERAPGRHPDQARRLAGDRAQPLRPAPVEPGDARQQAQRVGVAGGVVQLVGVGRLGHADRVIVMYAGHVAESATWPAYITMTR